MTFALGLDLLSFSENLVLTYYIEKEANFNAALIYNIKTTSVKLELF